MRSYLTNFLSVYTSYERKFLNYHSSNFFASKNSKFKFDVDFSRWLNRKTRKRWLKEWAWRAPTTFIYSSLAFESQSKNSFGRKQLLSITCLNVNFVSISSPFSVSFILLFLFWNWYFCKKMDTCVITVLKENILPHFWKHV